MKTHAEAEEMAQVYNNRSVVVANNGTVLAKVKARKNISFSAHLRKPMLISIWLEV